MRLFTQVGEGAHVLEMYAETHPWESESEFPGQHHSFFAKNDSEKYYQDGRHFQREGFCFAISRPSKIFRWIPQYL